MISLVKEYSVVGFKRQSEQISVQGITGAEVEINGQIGIENTLELLTHKCYIVGSLPRNLDIILGQDWLQEAGFSIQKKMPLNIPPFSEQLIRCKKEKGVHFIEHQLLQSGFIAASSLLECKDEEFPCLVVNLMDKLICMIAEPKV
jgi:hypothetical protein